MGPSYNIYITALLTDGPISINIYIIMWLADGPILQIVYTFTVLKGGLIDYFIFALGPSDNSVLLYINTYMNT